MADKLDVETAKTGRPAPRNGPLSSISTLEARVRTIALETSTRVGSIAAVEDGRPPIRLPLDATQRTARSLAPGLARLLTAAGWTPDSVDLVAVTGGPGSFTGLRIGMMTAKTLAFAAVADVLSLNTLEVIAAQVPRESLVGIDTIEAVIDAQRGELFAAAFSPGEERPREKTPTEIIDAGAWLNRLGPKTAVTGGGLKKLLDRIAASVRVVDSVYWTPEAATVSRLATLDYRSGRRDDVWTLAPRYYRRSAAEEKLLRRESPDSTE